MKKRFWALLLAVMMVVSVLPTAAFAIDEDALEQVRSVSTDGSVKITKSVNDTGDRLTMEAYVTGQVVTTNPVPLDIVLVLDVSGSMKDDISIVKEENVIYRQVSNTNAYVYFNWRYGDGEYWYSPDSGTTFYPVTNINWDANLGLDDYTYTYDEGNGEPKTYSSRGALLSPSNIYYKTVKTETITVSKMEALKNAVNSFIDTTAKKNAAITDGSAKHRISIVKFAGTSTDKISNEMYRDGQYTYNYSQIVMGLTTVDDAGADALKAEVNKFTPAGATAADYGMTHAQRALAGSNRKQVVIFFTDGEPNHGNGFNESVANATVNTAKELKADGATIYTIGVFAGADPEDIGSKANKFMHAVSSNYPEAENYTDVDRPLNDNGYYKTATTKDGLTGIFGAIAEDMIPDVAAGSNSVLTDTVSDWFTPVIPEDENVEAVTVEVWSAGGNEETATWTKDVSASDITVSVENKKISVTGFDYSANALAQQQDGSWTGKKLVISFAIAPKADAKWKAGNHLYPTNDTTNSKAGLYSESGKAFASLDRSPDVPITAYSVTYDANGGSFAQGVKHEFILLYGADMPKIATDDEPIRGNYTFKGWGASAEATTPIDLPDTVTKNVTYYAIWEQNPDQYSVTYDWKPDGLELYREDDTNPIAEPVESEKFVEGDGYTINNVYTSGTVAYTRDSEGKPVDRYIFSGWTTSDSDVAISDGKFSMPNHNVTLTGTWYLDNWQDNADGPDQPTGGDGTPDKYQVLVKYESKDVNKGTVTPEYEVITLTNGEVLLDTADVRVSGSTATPNPGYSFEKWTDNGGNTVTETIDDETTNVGPVLPVQTIEDAEGGTIYTYTAYWTENVPNLSVEKTVASVGGVEVDYTAASVNIPTAKVGDTIKWTITVTNNGDEDVTIQHPVDKLTITKGNAVTTKTLTAVPKEGDAAASYTLVAGASKEFTVEYTVLAEDLNAQIYNSATVNGVTGSTGEPVNVGATPGLSVTKTVNKTSVTVGDTVKYTITVKNTGNVDLTNVNVVEAFGGDFSKITNVTGADQVTKNGFVIRELKAGSDPVEITFSYKTTKRETLTNSVKVTGTYESGKTVEDEDSSAPVTVKNEPITPVGPSKPQLNYEDHYAYVVGYPDGLVHPERNITRAEVATIFFRMLLDESREYFWAQENDFSDVAETDWFNNAVSTLANAQLINGYPDGSYRPNANITRAEFATIAIRFFLDEDVEIEENNLSDVKGHWAEANINLAYALELINGYPDGTFRPDQKITRAEAMAIVNRVLKRAPEKDHLLKDMIEWPDNLNTAAWYYADVQEATNSHKFHMDKEEEYEIWTELLPVRDWVALEQEWSKANSSKNPGEVVDIKITTPEAGDNGLKLD